MERFRLMLIVFTLVIVAGIALMMVPPDYSEPIIEAREDVNIYWEIGSSSSIDLPPGEYQVWAPDVDPTKPDYEHFNFSIHDLDREVEIQYSDGSVVEDVEGTPHELYCTFLLEHGEGYFYDTESTDVGGEAEHFVIVFTREPRWADGPGVLIGLAMVIVGLVVDIVIVGERYARRDNTGP